MENQKNDVSTKDNDTHSISSKNNDSQPQTHLEQQKDLLRLTSGTATSSPTTNGMPPQINFAPSGRGLLPFQQHLFPKRL